MKKTGNHIFSFTRAFHALTPTGPAYAVQNRSLRFCRGLISPGWTYSDLPKINLDCKTSLPDKKQASLHDLWRFQHQRIDAGKKST